MDDFKDRIYLKTKKPQRLTEAFHLYTILTYSRTNLLNYSKV